QYLGFNGLHTDSNGSKSLSYSSNVSGVVQSTTYGNTNLELSRHVINLEAYGLFNTGLNLGLTFLKGNMKSSGDQGVNNILASGTGTPANGSSLGSVSLGTWYGAAGNHDLDGDALIVNLNYTIKALRSATVGVEFMDSDPDAFLYDSAARNRVGFYTARGGNSFHYYWSQPIDQNFRFQVGYQKVENKKTNFVGGYFGAPTDINNETTAVYSNLQFFF
ncbi:MAG: hypothetical protein VX341_06115, partial [Bdellovibrionota bacterium]|nr:hypothetical protein [Bdellovibrionota bacterium]